MHSVDILLIFTAHIHPVDKLWWFNEELTYEQIKVCCVLHVEQVLLFVCLFELLPVLECMLRSFDQSVWKLAVFPKAHCFVPGFVCEFCPPMCSP